MCSISVHYGKIYTYLVNQQIHSVNIRFNIYYYSQLMIYVQAI